MSLLYTMQGIHALGHTCIVALARPSRELETFYQEAGFQVIPWPGLALWDHSAGAPRPWWSPFSWQMLADLLIGYKRTARRMLELVDLVKPDLVHLNSMTFVLPAVALSKAKVPYVWHVREPPPDQGVRTRLIRHAMLRAPQLIYISDFDRQQWVRGEKGLVVLNFVDLTRFGPWADGSAVRRSVNIPSDAKVILYLGGICPIKGFNVLVEAMRLLKEKGMDLVCLAPGTVMGRSLSNLGRVAELILPLVGYGTPKQLARRLIEKSGLQTRFLHEPFVTDIASYYAASDVAVFPSTKPHFARPVVESIAMRTPAVGSDLGGVRELLAIHPQGVIAPAGDPVALADALEKVLLERGAAQDDLEPRYLEVSAQFDRSHGVKLINEAYYRVLDLPNATE